jgi:hypothetical protein
MKVHFGMNVKMKWVCARNGSSKLCQSISTQRSGLFWVFSWCTHKIHPSDLIRQELLGIGACGAVYRAMLRGETDAVAVKTLNIDFKKITTQNWHKSKKSKVCPN